MTKNIRKLLGLTACLAVLGGIYGGAVWFNQYSQDKKAEEEEAQTSWLSRLEEPVSIHFTNDYGTFEFRYDEELQEWKYAEDEHFPVTQSYLTTLANDMKALKAERKLEEVQEELSVYGLDAPSYSITAKNAENEEATILIGSKNSYSADYYAKPEGSDGVYTISSTLVTHLNYDISSLQKKESLPSMESSGITAISLRQGAAETAYQKIETTELVTEEQTEPESLKEAESQTAGEGEAETERKAESGSGEGTEGEAQTVNGSGIEGEAETGIREVTESDTETESTEPQTRIVTGWQLTAGGKTSELEDETEISALLQKLTALSFTDCADYYTEAEERKAYGLTDDAKVLTVTYESGTETCELVLTIGTVDDSEAYYYVSMNDSDEVNTISKESLDEVLAPLLAYLQETDNP